MQSRLLIKNMLFFIFLLFSGDMVFGQIIPQSIKELNAEIINADVSIVARRAYILERIGVGNLPAFTPSKTLDVGGQARIRNLPSITGKFVVADSTGCLGTTDLEVLQGPSGPIGPAGEADDLGNHTAIDNLEMNNFDIRNVKDIGGANMTIEGTGDVNIKSGDFLHLEAVNGITLDAPKTSNQGIGIGNMPDPDVYLSVNGTTRIKELPFGGVFVVMTDETGFLKKLPLDDFAPFGGQGGGGGDPCTCPLIWDLLQRVEALEDSLLNVSKTTPQNPSISTEDFALQPYPNPSDGHIQLNYTVPKEASIKIELLDLSGKVVANLLGETSQPKGNYTLEFDGRDLPNGTYIISLKTSDKIYTSKVVLSK